MSVLLYAIAIDCVDAEGLARFWGGVLARPVDEGATEDFASVGAGSGSGAGWVFVKVPEPKATKNRVHVDLAATDLAAETARVIELGATQLAEREEDGARWMTLADPEGNEFDLVTVAG